MFQPPYQNLPYNDGKPQGSADFYFAVNATFRFIIQNFGLPVWREFVETQALEYYAPVWKAWREGGLPAVESYLRDAFAAEPGAEFSVKRSSETVVLRVLDCPAISHLRKAGRKIVPDYCKHCFYQFDTMASQAGMMMRLEGGNGSCEQTFHRQGKNIPPQEMIRIKEAS